jgi:hypothetical protein
MVVPDRIDVGDDVETAVLGRAIDGGEEVEVVAVQIGLVPEEGGHLDPSRGRHVRDGVAVDVVDAEHVVAEPGAQPVADLSRRQAS